MYNGIVVNGEQMLFTASRLRQWNDTSEMPVVKGLRVEIFLRTLQKNTTRPLTIGKAERGRGSALNLPVFFISYKTRHIFMYSVCCF